jgi:hypothetical protein
MQIFKSSLKEAKNTAISMRQFQSVILAIFEVAWLFNPLDLMSFDQLYH